MGCAAPNLQPRNILENNLFPVFFCPKLAIVSAGTGGGGAGKGVRGEEFPQKPKFTAFPPKKGVGKGIIHGRGWSRQWDAGVGGTRTSRHGHGHGGETQGCTPQPWACVSHCTPETRPHGGPRHHPTPAPVPRSPGPGGDSARGDSCGSQRLPVGPGGVWGGDIQLSPQACTDSLQNGRCTPGTRGSIPKWHCTPNPHGSTPNPHGSTPKAHGSTPKAT